MSYIGYIRLVVDEEKRLADWESGLQREVERLQTARNRIDAELQRAAKKLDLVRQMRSLDDGHAIATSAASDVRATPGSVREMTQRILSELGRPLHINEIHQQFLARAYAIPGSGTPFNILAHLVNDKSFVRVARGTYALAGSVPPEQVLPKAERKARRRRRRRKASLRTRAEEA